jgi:hypothetical protein
MKLNEILLLELAEVLDRNASYGSWIDANSRKIFPVKKEGHTDFIRQKLGAKGVKLNEPQIYQIGFKIHLVRIVHDSPNELSIEGTGKDIQKIARMLIPSIVTMGQQGSSTVFIDKVRNVNDIGATNNKAFSLPGDRSAAVQYVQAG